MNQKNLETRLQVGVKALLHNTKRQFLLLKRASTYGHHVAGQWDIPGGRINPGSKLMDNLAREIKEETNLDLAYQPVLLSAQDILPDEQSGLHVVRLTYLARAKGDIILQPSEVVDFGWFTWEQMLKLDPLDPYVREITINLPQPLHLLLQSDYVPG